MQIWSDNYLYQVLSDAASDIVQEVDCLFHRFYLATTAGTPVYTLPDKVRRIKKITWRGIALDPMGWQDAEALFPSFANAGGSNNIDGSSSRPQYYALHPTNIKDIRLYPTPSETFVDTGGDPYKPLTNEARCTITCWRSIDLDDPLASLPTYIDRRTRKAYALWKAFGKEGPGQNSTASAYYLARYQFLMNAFKKINSGVYAAIRYTLNDGLDSFKKRPARPTLPPNFERVRYQ